MDKLDDIMKQETVGLGVAAKSYSLHRRHEVQEHKPNDTSPVDFQHLSLRLRIAPSDLVFLLLES